MATAISRQVRSGTPAPRLRSNGISRLYGPAPPEKQRASRAVQADHDQRASSRHRQQQAVKGRASGAEKLPAKPRQRSRQPQRQGRGQPSQRHLSELSSSIGRLNAGIISVPYDLGKLTTCPPGYNTQLWSYIFTDMVNEMQVFNNRVPCFLTRHVEQPYNAYGGLHMFPKP